MNTVYDVPASDLIKNLVIELKKMEEIIPPGWAKFVKTGTHKERPPEQEDWWYIRAAAILRTIYKDGPVGVQRLRTKYGGRKNRGVKPDKFKKGSGSVIRKIIQQLEKANLVEQSKRGRKGRIITPAGQKLINQISSKILKGD